MAGADAVGVAGVAVVGVAGAAVVGVAGVAVCTVASLGNHPCTIIAIQIGGAGIIILSPTYTLRPRMLKGPRLGMTHA